MMINIMLPDEMKLQILFSNISLGKIENTKYTHRYRICQQDMEHVFEDSDLDRTFDSDKSFMKYRIFCSDPVILEALV